MAEHIDQSGQQAIPYDAQLLELKDHSMRQ